MESCRPSLRRLPGLNLHLNFLMRTRLFPARKLIALAFAALFFAAIAVSPRCIAVSRAKEEKRMKLLRKDGSGVIVIPRPRHAWLSGQMAGPTPPRWPAFTPLPLGLDGGAPCGRHVRSMPGLCRG